MKKSPFDVLHMTPIIWYFFIFMMPFFLLVGPILLHSGEEWMLNIGGIIWMNMALISVVLGVIYHYDINLRKLIGPLPKGGKAWMAAVGIGGSVTGLCVFFTLGSAWLSSFYPLSWLEVPPESDVFSLEGGGLGYAVVLVANVALLGPVAEELLFRGLLVNRLARKWGLSVSVLVSSLLFALPHQHVVGGFVFGLVMALLYVNTRSLLLPVVIHVLNNTLAVGVGATELEIYPETPSSVAFYLALSVPALSFYLYKSWPSFGESAPYEGNMETSPIPEASRATTAGNPLASA